MNTRNRAGFFPSFKRSSIALCIFVLTASGADLSKILKKVNPPPEPSPIDLLLAAPENQPIPYEPSMGSTFGPDLPLIDIASDVHARRNGDLVTITVLDQASATSAGTTTTQRTSQANSNISSLLGAKSPKNALNNLLASKTQTQLNGQGTTSRQTTVSTAVSTRVIRVLPNGDLIIQGSKLIAINSESQTVTIRGIVRQVDLGPTNTVSSNQVEDLELRINGRGVVNDAIRRPNFLYRLLLGILPF